jgi:uncharacterized protein with HXXEE motif
MASWMSWAPLGAAGLHIVEEFFFPGGFAEWDRRYRPDYRGTITGRLHVVVNALLLLACLQVALLGFAPIGVAAWLTIMALLASNGLWHVVGALRTRSYSPGVATGLLLYLPLAIYGYARFIGSGQASPPTALAALSIGGTYHLWGGFLLHRGRRRG